MDSHVVFVGGWLGSPESLAKGRPVGILECLDTGLLGLEEPYDLFLCGSPRFLIGGCLVQQQRCKAILGMEFQLGLLSSHGQLDTSENRTLWR